MRDSQLSPEHRTGTAPSLDGKRALVLGAAGSIGAIVAKELAHEGADVYLSGRTRSSVEHVAKAVQEQGGRAHAAVVDALDDAAVAAYVDDVARQASGIDIAFNAVGPLVSDRRSPMI
jgi:3-oxoacyl-[acyl-carrier protein] reductase